MARLPSHFQMLLQEKEGVQAAERVYLSKVPRHHKHYCGTKTLIMVSSPGSDGCLVIPSTYEVMAPVGVQGGQRQQRIKKGELGGATTIKFKWV